MSSCAPHNGADSISMQCSQACFQDWRSHAWGGTRLRLDHRTASVSSCVLRGLRGVCRRLMVRHSFVPLLVHMLDASSQAGAALHYAFIRRAASTILARLSNRCAPDPWIRVLHVRSGPPMSRKELAQLLQRPTGFCGPW